MIESRSPSFKVGDKVLATGWGIGEKHWGGFSGMARMDAKWLTEMPQAMTSRQAMALGTAGLTAWLCVSALQLGGLRSTGEEVLVSGASGGVGSFAVKLLAKLGHRVVALTGKRGLRDYLLGLGATEVVMREGFDRDADPLEKERWASVVDTVGGRILATALSQARYGSTVSYCGLVSDFRLGTTVMPFILRGVRLQGIESVYFPAEVRQAHWTKLAELLPETEIEELIHEAHLGSVLGVAERMIRGEVHGRYVVDPSRN